MVASTLLQMIQEMKIAIREEIKETKQKAYKHTASNGKVLSDKPGEHIYLFTLSEPWEPQDDTSLKIKLGGLQDIKGTLVNATGTMITIATDKSLPHEALDKIILEDDPTELLEQLHDALETNHEGPTSLGSKCFGMMTSESAHRSISSTFGAKFQPDASQRQALQTATGSEVTFIVGPPGTGKTSTLAAIAFAHLQEGRNLLIAAHTNIAIDNAIMKLVDICRDTGQVAQLNEGRIVRYGVPQLRERMQSEYSEVYLPTIIKKRSSALQSQQEQIQTQIDQLIEQLRLAEESKKPWIEKRQSLLEQLKTCKQELHTAEEREQQRLKQLDEYIKGLSVQQISARQEIEFCQRSIAQQVAQQTQWQTKKVQFQSLENNLQISLSEAQQASLIKRFSKRLNPQKLALQLGEIKYQLDQCKTSIDQFEANLSQYWHPRRAQAENWLAQINAHLQGAEAQRQWPSPDALKITQLRTHINVQAQNVEEVNTRIATLQSSNHVPELTDRLEQLREERAAIDKQLADMEKNVVAEAQVVATTLCKTYMNKNLCERRFDVVILDEVSMAPLPAVYIAASRADKAMVALGDPQQLAPIYTAPAAKTWLGRDLFELNDITLKDAASGSRRSVLLQWQSRMHPQISHVASKHVYGDLIRDSARVKENLQGYAQVTPVPGKTLLLCDTSDYPSTALRVPNGGSHQNTYHALCSFQLACQVLATLPEPSFSLQDERFRVGIVTPYRSQADFLQGMVKDAGLSRYIRVGTVHRFQGLEAEAIIFDTVESLPLQPDPPFRLTSGQFGSAAMRLVNVAITRAQQKLIIVANQDYVKQYFGPHDTLRLAVQEAARNCVIQSADVLKEAHLTLPTAIREFKGDVFPEMLNDRTFYEYFFPDLKGARKQVTIFSPFLSSRRIHELEPRLVEKIKQGVRIDAIYSPKRNFGVDKERRNPDEGENYQDLVQRLRAMQIKVHTKTEMHEKIVFIDDNIAYFGSLNVLSHGNTTECMQRILSPSAIKQYKKDWQVETILALPERVGSPLEIFSNELPQNNGVCPKCNRKMILRVLKKPPYGAFYGCVGFHEFGCKHTEEITKTHLDKIARLTSLSCNQCKGPTRVESVRKDAWLVCAATPSCGYGQPIKIKP